MFLTSRLFCFDLFTKYLLKMLINKHTKMVGNKVILVPYRKDHVLKYHQWMQSEELQKLTASEPLTLEEEYEMQKSWMLDCNKCTFIILDKEVFDRTQNEIESMIGDTNLFFLDGGFEPSTHVAEAEIMIAEPEARGKQCGREALLAMLHYGISALNVRQYIVKISEDNHVSLKMFERIGFVRTGYSGAFKEVTMEKVVDDNFKQWLGGSVHVEIINEKAETYFVFYCSTFNLFTQHVATSEK